VFSLGTHADSAITDLENRTIDLSERIQARAIMYAAARIPVIQVTAGERL